MQNSSLKKISILLVDDHELVREGVARLLSDTPDIVVIGQLGSGEEVIEYLSHSDSNDMNLENNLPNNIYQMPDIDLSGSKPQDGLQLSPPHLREARHTQRRRADDTRGQAWSSRRYTRI